MTNGNNVPDADGFVERAGVGSLHSASEFSHRDSDADAAARAGILQQRPVGGETGAHEADDPLPTMTAVELPDAQAPRVPGYESEAPIPRSVTPEPGDEKETVKPLPADDARLRALLAEMDDPDATINADTAEIPYMLARYQERVVNLTHKVVHLEARSDFYSSYIGTQAKMVDALAKRLKELGEDPDAIISAYALKTETEADAAATAAEASKDGGLYT